MCRVNKYEVVCEKVAGYNAEYIDRKIVDSWDIYRLLTETFKLDKYPNERFAEIMLNSKGRIVGYHEVAIGQTSQCAVRAKEVFTAALTCGTCEAIVVAHNHPSGDPTPSKEDIDLTKSLVEAGKLLGIKVLDHLVIGDFTFESMKAGGYIE